MANFLYVTLAFMCFELGYSIKSYNMRYHCDSVISFEEDGIKSAIIQYNHRYSIVRDNLFKLDCTVEIAGWPGEDFVLQFLEFDIKNWQTTFGIVQGDSWRDGEQIHGLRKQFSYFSNFKRVYTTKYWRLFIRLKGKPPKKDRTLFKLVLNTYRTGHCAENEFRCQNGRCIDKNVTCNGYNPCGDSSDCLDRPETQMVLIVCGALIVLLLLLFSACKVCVICRHKDKRRMQDTSPVSANRNQRRTPQTDERRNNGNVTVTYNLVGGTNTVNGSGINDVVVQSAAPPSYESVIAGDVTVQLNDNNRNFEPAESSRDVTPDSSDSEHQNEHQVPRIRRPHRRHTSKYLPRYSEVLRNKDAYEVRTIDDSES